MTTSSLTYPSYRVHTIVEYIKASDNFCCDASELEERGIQEILQEDFDIYEALQPEELSEIQDELFGIALDNEIRESRHLFKKLHPDDEGGDYVHSSPHNIHGRRTTYRVEYSYPVDKNLRKLPKISYPLRPASQIETKRLSGLNKALIYEIKTEQKGVQKPNAKAMKHR